MTAHLSRRELRERAARDAEVSVDAIGGNEAVVSDHASEPATAVFPAQSMNEPAQSFDDLFGDVIAPSATAPLSAEEGTAADSDSADTVFQDPFVTTPAASDGRVASDVEPVAFAGSAGGVPPVDPPSKPTKQPKQPKPRRRATVTGVIGEILITVGVVVLLYVVWQMWIGDMIIGAESNRQGQAISQKWADDAKKAPTSQETSDPASKYNTVTADPVAIPAPQSAEDFAVLRIPRFGDDFAFTIAGGVTTWESLDLGKVGYYLDTGLPGQPGNFAVAGHRGSHGAPFMNLPQLQVGDAIVVETAQGWYTYRYRNMEYVMPSAVEVLLPTPQNAEAGVTGDFITLTTCSPRYGSAERLIAYGVFESFTPTTPDGKTPESLVLAKGR